MSPTSTSVRAGAPAALAAAACASAVAGFVLLVGESALPSGTRSDFSPMITAVLAVVSVVGLQRSGSPRTAWSLGAGAVLVLGSVRYLVPEGASTDTLTTVGVVASGTTGVLLGAAVAGAWAVSNGPWALLTGAWSAFLTAAAVGVQVPVDPVRWTITQWLLAIALVALVAAALTATPGGRAQRFDPQLLVVTALAAGVLALGYRLLGELVTSEAGSGGTRMWFVAVGALVVVVIGAEVVARVVPSGDDRFVLAVTGAVAAVYPAMLELFGSEQWWLPLLVVAAVAVGVWCSPYVPYAAAGLVVALAVSTAAVLWPQFAENVPLPVRLVLIAAGAGLALAASLPGSASVAALGLSLPVPMTAVIGAVWLVPADPRWPALALAAVGAVCAWQVR
ncbi:hypothetical protein ACFWCF_00295 [Rhodococcus sp. NPDC060090]|uniref:hypothetical protein n=1 Tax=Rhodococcus sp. NPDC060090 TaxID=3347056 RepID=UPI00364F5B51